MDERSDAEIYEPPVLIEVGAFTEKTLSGINHVNADYRHWWFHG